MARHRADDHEPVGGQGVLRYPQEPADVAQVALDPLLGRRLEAMLRQPRPSPSRPAGRVHDQLGGHGVRDARGTLDADPADAPVADGQAGRLAWIEETPTSSRALLVTGEHQPDLAQELRTAARALPGVPAERATEASAGRPGPEAAARAGSPGTPRGPASGGSR